MSSLVVTRRQPGRRILMLAALAGVGAVLAGAAIAPAADTRNKKPGLEAAAPKGEDEAPPPARDAKLDDQAGPPGPPPGGETRRPRPPRRDGRQGEPNANQPGPPRGPDNPFPGPGGQPRGPEGQFSGPGGPPRRPDGVGPGPGQPPGGFPRQPRDDFASMEKNDPELFKVMKTERELERSVRDTVTKYREAAKGERAKIKEELHSLVTKQFEARQQRRALELKRLEEELKQLRETAERREKDRKTLIDRHVSELLGEDESTF